MTEEVQDSGHNRAVTAQRGEEARVTSGGSGWAPGGILPGMASFLYQLFEQPPAGH